MKKTKKPSRHSTQAQHVSGSFRDPAGFVFRASNGKVYRQVNKVAQADYDTLMTSGLYTELVKYSLIVPHKKANMSLAQSKDAYTIISPEQIPFVSFPFEWSFSQLKDAALTTLRIQKIALRYGMSLKDASAYNIQFYKDKPVFIDTLSFELKKPGKPWQAYRQFCQHFLAPLALMSFTDVNLSQLLRVHIDGIPLQLASKLLPAKAKVRPGTAMHIVMHARAQNAKQAEHKKTEGAVSDNALKGILESLERTIAGMYQPKSYSEWGDYYSNTNYTANATNSKTRQVVDMIAKTGANSVLDFGGNNGKFSRALHKQAIFTVCTDIDPNAVEANYIYSKEHNEELMLPLLVDVTNPGGALGWQNTEREPIHERLKCDTVMALAIIHHLAISNNLPLVRIAEYLAKFASYLLIEFVPKSDSQVKKMLSTREDIFPDYDEEGFKKAFGVHYRLIDEQKVKGTKRTLYLFKKR